jgi:Clostridial hydrophobic W
MNAPSHMPSLNATKAQSSHSRTIVQSLLDFLDRNLKQFSLRTRNIIGVGVLCLLCVISVHAFLGPSYIQGHLFVQAAATDTKSIARRFIVVSGNETFLTTDNGFWMVPIRGFLPQPRLIQVQNTAGEFLAEFVTWRPWPVLNAIRLSEYEVVLHPYRADPDERIKVGIGPSFSGHASSVAALLGISEAYAQTGVTPVSTPVLVHIQGFGDIACSDRDWCGTRGESRRLEGFAVRLPSTLKDVQLQYMCHIQSRGDTQWLPSGQFCGTRGQSLRLEGFAMKLSGPGATRFRLTYQAHVQGLGDTRVFSDGEFAGTRGQGRCVEAIRVAIEPR